ncbi:hypothetical protein GCM10029964_057420 [Kibdelosporangium lantanae]
MARVYEYDVFISYQRGGTVPAWVRTHFYPRLSELLDDELTHEVRVFFDENVQAGGKWPEQLRAALRRTKILVAVCSPKYFQNEWCLAEWHSMARREELVGMAARSLIYPVIYCDSRNFPTYAHERRMVDLKDFNQPSPQFQDSPAYLDFYREVRRMAGELGELVETAPEWRPDWPVSTPTADPPKTSSLPRF